MLTSALKIVTRYSSMFLPAAALLTVAVLALFQPRFLTAENLINVLRQSAFLAIFALAQMIPVLTRGLDLSQGGIVGASSVVFALAASGLGIPAGGFFGLLVGATSGLLNGYMVAILRVSPFVATLGVGSILQGLALIVSNGQPIFDVPSGFAALAWGQVAGVPLPAGVAIAVLVLVHIVLTRTVPGRFVYAVGSNEAAAVLSGIPTRWVLLGAYTCSGILTALGALLLSARVNSGHPTVGADTALQAIAAVVIGGVSLFGGRGSAIGVMLGALFLGLLGNALNLLNVSSYVQQIVIGGAIIVAVALDRLRIRA